MLLLYAGGERNWCFVKLPSSCQVVWNKIDVKKTSLLCHIITPVGSHFSWWWWRLWYSMIVLLFLFRVLPLLRWSKINYQLTCDWVPCTPTLHIDQSSLLVMMFTYPILVVLLMTSKYQGDYHIVPIIDLYPHILGISLYCVVASSPSSHLLSFSRFLSHWLPLVSLVILVFLLELSTCRRQ